MRFTYVTYFFFLLFSHFVLSQSKQYELAHPSQKGIYVSLNLKTNTKFLDNDLNYTIERIAENEKEWKKIATVKTVGSLEEFRKNLIKTIEYIPEPFSINAIPYEKIWKKLIVNSIDSIGPWQNVLAVKCALGILYFDNTAQSTIKYRYRISTKEALVYESTSVQYPLLTADVGSLQYYSHEYDGRNIKITWLVKNKKPSYIRLFRQDQFKGNFVGIKANRMLYTRNDSIFVNTTDTITIENVIYNYFAIPMDEYGNWGKSSDTIAAAAFDVKKIKLPHHFKTIDDSTHSGIVLEWQIESIVNMKYLELYRSVSYEGDYQLLAEIPAHQTQFVDEDAEAMKTYFYYLRVVAADGSKLPPAARISGIFRNEDKPFPPHIISAMGIENGVQLDVVHEQSNIIGMRVYRAIVGDSICNQISDLIPIKAERISYVDSFNLNPRYFYTYKITLENASHQTSDFSNQVSAKPIMLTSISAPINLNSKLEDGKVILNWYDMQQIDENIIAYLVYRCQFDSLTKTFKAFQPLHKIPLNETENHFVDSTVIKGNSYKYAVKSANKFGAISEMSESNAITYGYAQPISPNRPKLFAQNNGILVEWDEIYQEDIKTIILYKYQRGESPVVVKNFPLNQHAFVDVDVKKGGEYFYYLTTVSKSGIESFMGEESGTLY